jgi:pyruvate ferredoxin oxidoreductase alpha subunit
MAGGFTGTAQIAVDRMREQDKKVGLLRLKLWRPFPHRELREAVKDARLVVVVDRALSVAGPGGPIASELRSSLYHLESRPAVYSFIAGLSGRDILIDQFVQMVERAEERLSAGDLPDYEMFGVRE